MGTVPLPLTYGLSHRSTSINSLYSWPPHPPPLSLCTNISCPIHPTMWFHHDVSEGVSSYTTGTGPYHTPGTKTTTYSTIPLTSCIEGVPSWNTSLTGIWVWIILPWYWLHFSEIYSNQITPPGHLSCPGSTIHPSPITIHHMHIILHLPGWYPLLVPYTRFFYHINNSTNYTPLHPPPHWKW